MNYKQIVNKLIGLKKKDDKIDKAFKWFIESISPDYTPFIEFNGVAWYLEAIKIIDKGLADDLSRFLYEISESKWEIVTSSWIEYKIRNKNDFINYLEKECNNTK